MSLERGTTPRLSITRLTKKFSLKNREYDKVEDMHDTRVPVHNDEAFQHGIRFKGKYIGSLEIARPTCKIDIITAMRRIRYEFKVKGIRKRRCYLDISTQGVMVTKRKRKRRRKQYTEEQLKIVQHPIYRIFYVSHDSQDLKIFSYITREVPDNTFRCNVFKAYKKGAALHIVRSLGQAFDVCHKLNPKPLKKKAEEEAKKPEEGKEGEAETSKTAAAAATDLDAAMKKLNLENGEAKTTAQSAPDAQTDFSKDLMQLQFDPFNFTPTSTASQPGSVPNGAPFVNMDPFQTNFAAQQAFLGSNSMVPPPPLTVSNTTMSLPDFPDGADTLNATQAAAIPPPHAHLAFMGRPRPRPGSSSSQGQTVENPFTDPTQDSPTLSIGQPLGTIRETSEAGNPFQQSENPPSMWEMEKQQLTAAVTLLTEQLKAETAARIESQARVEHLLMQNKELLSHLQKLMAQLQQLQSLQLSQLTNADASSSPVPTAADAEAVASPSPAAEKESSPLTSPPPTTESVSPPTTEAVSPPPTTEALSPPPTTEALSPPPTTESVSPPMTEAVSPPLVSSPSPTAENPSSPPIAEDPSSPPIAEDPISPPITENSSPLPVAQNPNPPPAPVFISLLKKPAKPVRAVKDPDPASPTEDSHGLNFELTMHDTSPLIVTEKQSSLLPTTDPFAPLPVSLSPTHTDETDSTSVDGTNNEDTEHLQPSSS